MQTSAGPPARGDDVARANPAVVIGVNQLQRLGIKFQTGGRTSQRHPKFLVKLVEVQQIRAAGEFNLIESTCAPKTPNMSRSRHRRKLSCRGKFEFIFGGFAVFRTGPTLGDIFENLPAKLLFFTGAFAEVETDIKQVGRIEAFLFLQMLY